MSIVRAKKISPVLAGVWGEVKKVKYEERLAALEKRVAELEVQARVQTKDQVVEGILELMGKQIMDAVAKEPESWPKIDLLDLVARATKSRGEQCLVSRCDSNDPMNRGVTALLSLRADMALPEAAEYLRKCSATLTKAAVMLDEATVHITGEQPERGWSLVEEAKRLVMSTRH